MALVGGSPPVRYLRRNSWRDSHAAPAGTRPVGSRWLLARHGDAEGSSAWVGLSPGEDEGDRGELRRGVDGGGVRREGVVQRRDYAGMGPESRPLPEPAGNSRESDAHGRAKP